MLVVTEFSVNKYLIIIKNDLHKPNLGGILVEESKYRLSISWVFNREHAVESKIIVE